MRKIYERNVVIYMKKYTWKLRVRPYREKVRLLQVVTTSNAAFPSHEVVENQPTSPALTRRKFLQINVDLKLDVVTYTLDAFGWVVLANEILLASFEEPEVSFVNFLKSGQQ